MAGRKDCKVPAPRRLARALHFHAGGDSDGDTSADDFVRNLDPIYSDKSDTADSDCAPTPIVFKSRVARARSGLQAHRSQQDSSDSGDDMKLEVKHSPKVTSWTPPHKKLNALRLFDTPHTPKSLLEKSRKRKSMRQSAVADRLQANVNPFTPCNNSAVASLSHAGLKRTRSNLNGSVDSSSDEDSLNGSLPSSKKIALREINTSRYNEEFVETEKLGDGEFGSVYKCVNRLDGCTYAIKKSKMPVAGSVYERNAMNEVYAHAVLGKHPQVVRYYSAWAENDHMYIQDEYCDGGSLADRLSENYGSGCHYTEPELCQILSQTAHGLKYIHSQNLAHLDIKPANIFIHHNETTNSSSGDDDKFDEDEYDNPRVLYKIGDLGHVTSVTNPSVEEGDCRYLPREVLQENFDHLTKADIFALGLTMFEAAGGGDLPKNGDAWQAIRNGNLPYLVQYSQEFNELLKKMIRPDARMRPSAAAILQEHVLSRSGNKSKTQLKKELDVEKLKSEELAKKLREATLFHMEQMAQMNARSATSTRTTRIIGRKVNRSMSLTGF